MTRRTLPRTLIALSGALLAVCARPAPGAAQAGDPRVEVWLYSAFVGVQTSAAGRPSVRVLDQAGNARAAVTAQGQATGGRWQVALSPGAGPGAQVLVRPGDRVEVTLDGRVTRVTAAEMSAEADAGSDAVTGTAPAGTLGLYLQLHRDPAWFDPPLTPDAVGPIFAGTDGRFRADLAGKFDIEPGTWGEAVAVGADGTFTIFPFAPPALIVHTTEPYAVIRANPTTRPLLTTRDGFGAERFRSGPAIPLGEARFAVLLVRDGIPANGVYEPGPDETAVLLLDERPALEAPLPRVLASVDPAGEAVWGYAPAGSRVTASLVPSDRAGTAALGAVVRADADGRFRAPFGAAAIEAGAVATVLAHQGRGVARMTTGGVPAQEVLLYGSQFGGTLPGWGEVTVEQWAADGTLAARMVTATGADGAFLAQLVTRSGQVSVLRPGDRLRAAPALGYAVEIVLPPLSVEVDAGRKSMRGHAPPDAPLTALIYPNEPDYFGPEPYNRPYLTLTGRSEAGGAYTLRCASDDCLMRYGLVATRVGSVQVILQWLDQPFVGVGVSLANAIGRATAGLPVKITPFGRDGRPGASITDLVRPGLGGGLPLLEIALTEAFPDGLRADDKVKIEIGARSYDIAVPSFAWQPDPATDSVAGMGPALRPLFLIAEPRNNLAGRPEYASTTAVIGLDRRWQARFGSFDLRAGDDLDLYLLYANEGYFLWWYDASIQGENPEPTPTAVPTARPTTTPAARRGVFVPYAGRG